MIFSFVSHAPLLEWTAPLGSFFSEPWRQIVLSSLLLLLLVAHYLLPALVVHYKKEQLYRRLPSPATSPILGRILGHLEVYWNAPPNLKNRPPAVWFHHLIKHLVGPTQKAGESLFLYRFGPFRKLVMVINGEAARALLSSRKHLEKTPEYEFVKEFVGDTLLTGTIAKWRIHRKKLTPAFHMEILHKFLDSMNAHSHVFCDVVRSKSDTSTGVALLPDIRQMQDNCMLDILCETTMGVQLNCQTQEDEGEENGSNFQGTTATAGKKFAELIFTGADLACERVLTPWLYPNFTYRLSALGRKTAQLVTTGRKFTNSIIAERNVTLSKAIADCATVEEATARLTDGKRLTFLDLLLVNHLKDGENALTLSQIEDEACFFMIAGMDNTSTTLQMAMLLLGLHPDKQALLHAELDTIFAGDTERHIDLDDLGQMKYLEQVIKETLRLYPSIPLIGRTLSEDFQLDKYLVPEGTTVVVNIAAIHRDPAVWKQGDDFLPERFSPDAGELGPTNSYLPFSLGSRNCLGFRFAMLALKIFLATLLRNYTVRSLTAQEEIQMGFFIIAKACSPISIEFTPRNVNVQL